MFIFSLCSFNQVLLRTKYMEILSSLQTLLKTFHKPILKIVIVHDYFLFYLSEYEVDCCIDGDNNGEEYEDSYTIGTDENNCNY